MPSQYIHILESRTATKIDRCKLDVVEKRAYSGGVATIIMTVIIVLAVVFAGNSGVRTEIMAN